MNSSEPRFVCVEAVGRPARAVGHLQRLDLPATLSRHFPTPLHWKGPLCPATSWPSGCSSCSPRRPLSQPRLPWVETHRATLHCLLGKAVLPGHFHDDRLADCLDPLSGFCELPPPGTRPQPADRPRLSAATDLVRHRHHHRNSYAEVLSSKGCCSSGTARMTPIGPSSRSPRLPGHACPWPRRLCLGTRRTIRCTSSHHCRASVPRLGRADLRG